MSYTEIFVTQPNGDVIGDEEFANSYRGAMFVWNSLGRKAFGRTPGFGSSDYERIWNLIKTNKISNEEKITLGTTYDGVMVKKEHLPIVADAFRKFAECNDPNGGSSLTEQAERLEDLFNKEIHSVSWCQTSVCDHQMGTVYDDDNPDDEGRPYNIFKDKGHWFLDEDNPHLFNGAE